MHLFSTHLFGKERVEFGNGVALEVGVEWRLVVLEAGRFDVSELIVDVVMAC